MNRPAWLEAELRGHPFAVYLARTVWVALLLGVIGRVLLSPTSSGSVLPIYLAAGERWWNAEPLYPPQLGLDVFRNPPGVAALFAPLSKLDPLLVAVLWRIACYAIYGLGIRAVLRDVVPGLSLNRRCWIWIISAVLVVPAFNNGQINVPIIGAGMLGVAAAARRIWWPSAFWLAFAAWWKIYPLAIGALVVLLAPKQLSWRLAIALIVLFALPFALQNPAYVWDRHFELIRENQTDDRSNAHWSRAPRDWTIVARMGFESRAPRPISLAVALLAAVVFADRTWVNRNSKHPYLRPLVYGSIWLTLFGPATEFNTYAIFGPAAGLVLFAMDLPRWGRWCAGIGTALLFAAVVRASFPDESPSAFMVIQSLGVALVMVACLAAKRK